MSADVEMNAVNSPLLDDQKVDRPSDAPGDKEIDVPDVEVKDGKSVSHINQEFTGLTKEQLEQYAKDPFWQKLRLGLFVAFWLIWFAMLVSAICIVIFSKKCPERPKLQFWQKNTGYWVDPFAFSDSDFNGYGDFNGLIGKLDYIKNDLGAKYIILDQIFKGQVTNKQNMFGLVEAFDKLDTAVGDRDELVKLVKAAKKKGIDVVMSVDINSLQPESLFFKNVLNSKKLVNKKMKNWVDRNGKKQKGGDYSSMGVKLDLDLTNNAVMEKIKESLKGYLENGIMGFLMTNVPVYVEDTNATSRKTNYSTVSPWFSDARVGTQVFAEGTKTILKDIRQIINGAAKTTDRPKVLIADLGEVGFELGKNDKDEMIQYLEKDIGVDMVISRAFLKRSDGMYSVKEYINSTKPELYNKMALVSATPVNPRPVLDYYRHITPFLLPGNPIIYFGSELGLKAMTIKTGNLYPKDLKFPDSIPKDNHLPMPWNNELNGGFSNTSLKDYFPIMNSARGMTAIGQDTTIFQIYQQLIKLRSKESMLWGEFSFIEAPKVSNAISQIFKREAKGFKPFIVAIVSDNNLKKRSISFKSVCKESNKLKTVFMHPVNPYLSINKVIAADNINLRMSKEASFYVFECV